MFNKLSFKIKQLWLNLANEKRVTGLVLHPGDGCLMVVSDRSFCSSKPAVLMTGSSASAWRWTPRSRSGCWSSWTRACSRATAPSWCASSAPCSRRATCGCAWRSWTPPWTSSTAAASTGACPCPSPCWATSPTRYPPPFHPLYWVYCSHFRVCGKVDSKPPCLGLISNLLQVLEALHYMKRTLNLMHRDVKPSETLFRVAHILKVIRYSNSQATFWSTGKARWKSATLASVVTWPTRWPRRSMRVASRTWPWVVFLARLCFIGLKVT